MSQPPVFSGRELAVAALIVLIWGLNFVVMKFGLQEFTPFQLAAARFALASVPLLAFVRLPALPWAWVVLYGLLQGVGQFGFLFTALKVGMSASLASVLMQTQVFFTAVIAWAWLGEPITRRQFMGMGLAACGLLLFAMHFVALGAQNTATPVGNDQFFHSAGPQMVAVTVLGFSLNLGAAASWAAANVAARRATQANAGFEPLQFVVWSSLVPVLPLVLMSAVADPAAAHANWLNAGVKGWGAAVYLALCATVLAYTLWTRLLQRHAAARVAPFGLAVPLVGISAGYTVLGERISAWQWAGVGAVVLSLLVVLWPQRSLHDSR